MKRKIWCITIQNDHESGYLRLPSRRNKITHGREGQSTVLFLCFDISIRTKNRFGSDIISCPQSKSFNRLKYLSGFLMAECTFSHISISYTKVLHRKTNSAKKRWFPSNLKSGIVIKNSGRDCIPPDKLSLKNFRQQKDNIYIK